MRVQIKNNFTYILILFLFFLKFSVFAQPTLVEDAVFSGEQVKEMIANEDVLKEWLETLQKPGVILEDNKMIFSDEAQKLAQDANYRATVYKSTYSIQDVKDSLESFEIQKAFWRMINLYPENKELMLQFIYAYDKTVPSDELVTASFYTYAFFDPRITTIVDGKPEIKRPDLFEEYFRITKEIATYIALFREQEKTAE